MYLMMFRKIDAYTVLEMKKHCVLLHNTRGKVNNDTHDSTATNPLGYLLLQVQVIKDDFLREKACPITFVLI